MKRFLFCRLAIVSFIFLGTVSAALHAQEEVADAFTTAYEEAAAALEQKNVEAATEAVQRAQELKPEDPRTYWLAARLCQLRNDDAEAAHKVRTALERDPKHVPSLVLAGDLAFAKRDFSAAQRFYQRLLEERPKQKDGMLKLALCQIGQGNVPAARAYLSKLDPADSNHPGHYFLKAALARVTGKAEQAEKELQLARTLYGNTVWAEYARWYFIVFSSGYGASSDSPKS